MVYPIQHTSKNINNKFENSKSVLERLKKRTKWVVTGTQMMNKQNEKRWTRPSLTNSNPMLQRHTSWLNYFLGMGFFWHILNFYDKELSIILILCKLLLPFKQILILCKLLLYLLNRFCKLCKLLLSLKQI